MARLLSLDQSLTFCGYAIFEFDKNDYELLHYGTVNLNTKLDYFQRILSLEHYFNEMVKDFNIGFAVIEDVQKHRNAGMTTYKKLTSLLFYCQYYFYHKRIDYDIIHVSTWRSQYKKLYGLQKISKQIVHQHLYEQLGQPSQLDHHQSDAIGMGITACTNRNINPSESIK